MAGTEVPYRVVSASSEEHGRSARLLHQHESSRPKRCEGWSSARWCEWPQELVLRFPAPIFLQSLQLVAHEYKIASSVELFVGRVPADGKMPVVGHAGVCFERRTHMPLTACPIAAHWKVSLASAHTHNLPSPRSRLPLAPHFAAPRCCLAPLACTADYGAVLCSRLAAVGAFSLDPNERSRQRSS